MHGNVIHWGICCAGKICQDFVKCLNSLPKDEHVIEAVASSSLERAKSFADEHAISKSYGAYQELASDPEIDVVYIGSLNVFHYENTKMMLEGGKAVLCEKPFCMSSAEAKSLFDLAKQKRLFLMEAVWSRCSPAYAAIDSIISSGEIGIVKTVQSMFGYHFDPTNRVMNKEHGGGALFDIGVYQIQLAQLVFKENPVAYHAHGFFNEQGVDIMSNMILEYPNEKLSTMTCSTTCFFPNNAYICGSKGVIQIHKPFWSPTSITVNGKLQEFPLPKVEGPLNFINSEGLTYEAQEVRRCLLNKWIESPVVSHKISMELAEVTEKLRKKLGYIIPQDQL